MNKYHPYFRLNFHFGVERTAEFFSYSFKFIFM